MLALLEQAPLDEAPRILATDLTRDGPRVCEAMLRAIADDTDERRLAPGGALAPLAARIGELAGATGAEATSHAVDALQAVVWAALRAELRSPDPDLITEIVERLAQVTELMRAAALRHSDAAGSGQPTGPSLAAVRPIGPDRSGTAGVWGRSAADDPLAAIDLSVARGADARDAPPVPGDAPPVPGDAPPVPGDEPPVPGDGRDADRSWLGPRLESEPQSAAERKQSPGWAGPGRSARVPEALWIGALQDEIQRTRGAPLSLVLAELEDADKVVAVERPDRSATTFGEFAKAVRGAVRRQDILVCETEARAWIIARDTGRSGAQALGSRISEAVRETQPWRGAPMAASVGVAVLGEDGRSTSELIEAAEEARFAAAASGIDIVGAGADDAPPEHHDIER